MTRRKWLIRSGIGFAVLAVLYVIGWFVVAGRLEEGIGRWVAERRDAGWTAEYSALRVGGFPLAWRAAIENPKLATRHLQPAVHC